MDKKTSFLFWIVIVVLLALGISLINSVQRVPKNISYSEKNFSPNNRTNGFTNYTYPIDESIQRLKNSEILGLTDEELNNQSKQGEKRDSAIKHYLKNDNSDDVSHSIAPNKIPYTSSNQNEFSTTNPSSMTTSRNGFPTDFQMRGNEHGAPTDSDSKKQTNEFSPYLANLSKDQAKNLEQQLSGLSSRVERAVLQALLPKSKKNANIEKYLQKNAQSTVSTNPFNDVLVQVNAQKGGIIKSMQEAFGNQAAKETSAIMESYQKELQEAINTPGLSAEQIAQKTRQISAKYDKKLQKTTEKHAKEKFKNEQEQKDKSFQDELANIYGDKIAQLAGDKLAEYRQKEIEIASQKDLTPEEYYTQILENQRERRKAIEQLLIENGQSIKGLQTTEDKLEQQKIQKAIQDEETGKVLPKSYKASDTEKKAFNNSLQAERNEKVDLAKSMYGNAGATLVNGVYNEYNAKATQIMDDPETSRTEKQQLLMEARKEANAKIEQIQNRPEMKEIREQNQVENTLANIMKDPGIAKATPEQQEAFAKQARPVLHQMFSKINTISADPNLSEEQKKKQIQAAQEEAQQLLGKK